MLSIRLAFQNLWRNKLLTAATILIMGLILFIFNVIWSVNWVGRNAIAELESKVDLILYIKDDADPLLVNQLTQDLKTFPETVEVNFTSKDNALAGLLAKYPEDLNPFQNSTLKNPLPASLQILTQKPEDHDVILAYLDQSPHKNLLIDTQSNRENRAIVEQLLLITGFSKKILLGIVATFILGSILIIANAIHMTIFTRRHEIRVMQVVGATHNFIRAPFIVEGAFYGISSVILGILLFWIFLTSLQLNKIAFINLEFPYLGLIGLEIIFSTIVGIISSVLAVHTYLKTDKAFSE